MVPFPHLYNPQCFVNHDRPGGVLISCRADYSDGWVPGNFDWEAVYTLSAVCDNPSYPRAVDENGDGTIDKCFKPLTACTCTQDLVAGTCVARDVTYQAQVNPKGQLEFVSDANNQGLSCETESEPQRQCSTGAAAAPVGHPIACATGATTHTETDYPGTGLTPSVTRPYSTRTPEVTP